MEVLIADLNLSCLQSAISTLALLESQLKIPSRLTLKTFDEFGLDTDSRPQQTSRQIRRSTRARRQFLLLRR